MGVRETVGIVRGMSRGRPAREGNSRGRGPRRPLLLALVGGLAGLTGYAVWETERNRPGGAAGKVVRREPERVMGTTCRLMVVVPPGREAEAGRALESAESVLRRLEARLSVHLADSEISRLNAAPVGEEVPLSPETLELLRLAERGSRSTRGAFDPTCLPLVRLWGRAGREGRAPAAPEIRAACAGTGWRHFELRERGAVRRDSAAGLDLGGIAKGHAVDAAAEVLRAAGFPGGLVQVGGETRVFGAGPDGGAWAVGLRSPFRDEVFATLRLKDRAVSTSGPYHRFAVIDGRRRSHIVDPRTGEPADEVPSATVAAPAALEADLWATALSVLGPPGLDLLPRGAGLEALLITGSAEAPRIHRTPGFGALLGRPAAGAD